MAERSTAKSKRTEVPRGASKAATDGQPKDEIARLQAELAVARVRIAELEQKQADVINRIDWVIDSLHNLSD